MNLVYILLLVLSLYDVDCKKRHHRHKKLVSDGAEDGTVAATSDAAGAVPPPPIAPVEERPSLPAQTVTPADSTPALPQPFAPKADNTMTQSSASEPVLAPPPTPLVPSTKESIQKTDTEQKDKDTYRWTNHTIPFLKRFKKEIDGGKIKHHNYEEMTWFLKYFAEEFPDITRLYSIGRSVQNRKLWVLEISDNPGQHDPGEPEMKYIGNIHGNEVIGREILLQLVKHLCTHYEEDPEVRDLVDKTRIHVFPSLNPDGYELSATHKKSLNPDITEDVIGRLNANGVDLNRNFPDQFFEANSDSYEPESEAVMTWIRRYPFALSASFHSGALVVTYPFDDSPSGQTQYSATPDDDLFRQISKTYSENHPKMHLANPHEINCTRSLKRFTDGISNGASWSPLTGGMQDYNYVRSNCYEVTVELGCEKFPHEDNLKTYWHENKKSLLKFIEFSNRGVKGFVKDHTGNPIKGARISVGDRKHDVRSAIDGDYWRLLVPGTYELECHAKGFKRNAANVEIPIGGQVVVNFTMLPKQIDELEEALGHVNKATLLSHDLMYRFDGRDSGNAAPKEVMQKVEAQRTGREGTTDEQDTPSKYTNTFPLLHASITEDDAQKLADRIEANTFPLDNSKFVKGLQDSGYALDKRGGVNPGYTVHKRTKVNQPEKSTDENIIIAERSDDADVQKRGKINRPDKSLDERKDVINAERSDESDDVDNSTVINDNNGNETLTNVIDPALSQAVLERFHFRPVMDMTLQCTLTGKTEPLVGTLKYMGHLNSLPSKRNTVVAGIELQSAEDLGTDGTFLGKRYFYAPLKRGYFVPIRNCTPRDV